MLICLDFIGFQSIYTTTQLSATCNDYLEGGITMDRKTITIETNTLKKKKLDRRSFSCQILEFSDRRMYVLDDTKRTLGLKRFTLEEGCRVIDDGVTYSIAKIFFSPAPQQTFLIVYPESHL